MTGVSLDRLFVVFLALQILLLAVSTDRLARRLGLAERHQHRLGRAGLVMGSIAFVVLVVLLLRAM